VNGLPPVDETTLQTPKKSVSGQGGPRLQSARRQIPASPPIDFLVPGWGAGRRPSAFPKLHFFIDFINRNAYTRFVKSSEFKRWLVKQGATFRPGGKGSHLKIDLNGKTSVLPMHSKELKTGAVEGIKKQLGLK
jgi:mRNA interferase HicA